LLDLAFAWLGGLALGIVVNIGIALKMIDLRDKSELTFAEVCRAAAAAKRDRRADENLNRDYVDGADGVMGELLDRGFGDSPEEMRTAYLAGGEDPELEEAGQS